MTVEVFVRQHERSEKVTDISEWFFGGEKELVGFTRATTAARQMCEDKIRHTTQPCAKRRSYRTVSRRDCACHILKALRSVTDVSDCVKTITRTIVFARRNFSRYSASN